jgi:hypothetical protein
MPVSPLIPPPAKSNLGRNLLIASALLLPLIVGVFWLKTGRVTALSISLAASTSAIFAVLGGLQILQLRRAIELSHPQRIRDTSASQGEPGMKVQLCRKAVERLGPDGQALLSVLRDREHTPVIRECLSRCQECNSGMLLAIADGIPLTTTGVDGLLRDLDELAKEED